MKKTITVPVAFENKIFDVRKSVDVFLDQGLKAHKLNQLDKAEENYIKILTINPNNSDALNFLSVIYYQKKNLDKALELIEYSIKYNPNNYAAYCNRGIFLKELKRYEESIESYDNAIRLDPNSEEAFFNRGLVLKILMYYKKSLLSYNKALSINPLNAETYFSRGIVLNELELLIESLESYDEAIKIKPFYKEAYNNRGMVLFKLKRLEESLESLKKAIEFDKKYAEAYNNLGLVFHELEQYDNAFKAYDEATKINDNYAEAYLNRGVTLQAISEYEESLACYDRAILINSKYFKAYANRGIVLHELNRFEESLNSLERAIKIKPDYAQAFSSLGVVLENLKRFDKSLENYDKAVEIDPKYAQGFLNRSMLLLRMGDFDKGLRDYEWRWESNNFTSPKRIFSRQLWLGKVSIKNKIILIHSEQGLGDTIQFCRYLNLVHLLGAHIIFEVESKLIKLLESTLIKKCTFVPKGASLPKFDFHCPLMSLPLAFCTNISNIPRFSSYLLADESKVNFWASRIKKDGFKIGICWQGSQAKVDLGRSIPVSFFKQISKIPNLRLISLQKGYGEEQLEKLPGGMKIENLGDDFDNGPDAFIDSAAVMKCLDLVITVDTSIAHLAGAIGVETWVALQWIPDWRWLIDRNDSPWYPAMRLFRQKKKDKWDNVFEEMKSNLIKMI